MTKSKEIKADCRRCKKTENRRDTQAEWKSFHDLNPKRDPHSRIQLNPQQRQYLIDHYLKFPKGYVGLCRNCLAELIWVAPGVITRIQKVENERQKSTPRTNQPTKKSRGRKPLSNNAIQEIKAWAISNSLPNPVEAGKRFFPAEFPSKRAIYRRYASEHQQGGQFFVSRSTFWRLQRRFFSQITVREFFLGNCGSSSLTRPSDWAKPILLIALTHFLFFFFFLKKQKLTKAACDVCAKYHISERSYRHWLAHSQNATPEQVREKNDEWKEAYLAWSSHTHNAREERKKYLELKEECQKGQHPDLLLIGMDAKELLQLPHFGVAQPRVCCLSCHIEIFKESEKNPKEIR